MPRPKPGKTKPPGEEKEAVQWHKIVIWNDNLVTIAEKYLRKGSKVYIEGSLETRKWQDQSGQDKYSTEVVLKQYRGELTMLDSKNANSTDHGNQLATTAPSGRSMPAASSDLDDEIVF